MSRRTKNNHTREKFSLNTRTLDGSYVKDNVKWCVATSEKSAKNIEKKLRRHKAKTVGF